MRKLSCTIIAALAALAGLYAGASYQLKELHDRFTGIFSACDVRGIFCYRQLETDCGSWILPDAGIRSARYALRPGSSGDTLRLEAEERLWGILPCRHELVWAKGSDVVTTSAVPLPGLRCVSENPAQISIACMYACVLAEGAILRKLESAPEGSEERRALMADLRTALQEQLTIAREVKDTEAERHVLRELSRLDAEEQPAALPTE